GRVRGGDPADLLGARAVVRDPGRPQVVPELGRQPHRDREDRGHESALSRAGRGPRRHHDHIDSRPCRVIFRQLIHDDLGCASYLVGDEHAGVAAVVDPKIGVDDYLHLARFLGVAIDHVLETHTHADHVSGHGRLRAATAATIHVPRDAGAQYEHEPFDDGWELALGDVRVHAVHTPGHRPEHTAFALTDLTRGPEPWAALTGDT